MSPSSDYALTLAWFGEQDKPPRRAVLASPSRAAAIGDDPLVAVATIARAEFDAAVAALEGRDVAFDDGRPSTDLDAYAAVVEDGDRVRHASLGLEAGTLDHLGAIADALEPAHRAPIDAVAAEARALVGSASEP